jgi:hypothetical protein
MKKRRSLDLGFWRDRILEFQIQKISVRFGSGTSTDHDQQSVGAIPVWRSCWCVHLIFLSCYEVCFSVKSPPGPLRLRIRAAICVDVDNMICVASITCMFASVKVLLDLLRVRTVWIYQWINE